jgi:hypothetical protein
MSLMCTSVETGSHRWLGHSFMLPMIGPPRSPLQIDFEAGLFQTPGEFALTVVIGLAIACLSLRSSLSPRARLFWFCLGHTIVLTTPLLGLLDVAVFGDYPTVDKQGSLLFYLDGVHERVTFSPFQSLSDPAAQLIGVHVGHLWMVAALDIFFSPHGAMNGLGILLPALAWWGCALLLREFKVGWEWAVAMSLPFGLGLHLFRDLNWYTIEKAAIFWLPLFFLAVLRAYQRGGRWPLYAAICFALMAFTNWYLALVSAAALGIGQVCMIRDKRLWRISMGTAALALPLAIYQMALLINAPNVDPQIYLDQRAALDILSLGGFQWNRLPLWRAVELLAFSYGIKTIFVYRNEPIIRLFGAVATGLFLLAIGPNITSSIQNPVFMIIWNIVPGFWRVAKPEVFFYGTWLLVLACSAYGLSKSIQLNVPSRNRRLAIYCVSLVWWVFAVRNHEVYPQFSTPVETELGEVWRAALN